MDRPVFQLCIRAARACGRGVLTLARWTLWLGLGILLAFQVYIARTHELGLPRFLRAAMEERLAETGIHAAFGRAIFDPSGRILIERVELRLPGFEEPVATARGMYLRLDPWALALGRFKPVELRVTGASLAVPAMLSPSGRADEIVRDLDAGLSAAGTGARLDYLTCRVGNLAVAARGAVQVPPAAGRPNAPPLAGYLAENYGALSRRCAAGITLLDALDRPVLRLVLSPGGAGAASVRATLDADGLRLAAPAGFRAGRFEASGSFAVSGNAVVPAEFRAEVSEAEATFIGGAAVRRLRARLRGAQWDLAAAELSAGGETARDVIVVAGPAEADGRLPDVFQVEANGRLWSEPLAVRAAIDLGRRAAEAAFEGALGPGILDAAGARLGSDLRKSVNFTESVAIRGELRLDPGWKFARGSARVAAKGIAARGVVLDEVRGLLEFDGRRLAAAEAFARVGENFARGSYEQDVATNDYRFVLVGRLRPLDISPWIGAAWWREFFGDFGFPAEPPSADIDLHGCWGNGRKAIVFVAVDSASPVVRGVPFDRVYARLFIRPQFKDGLRLTAVRGASSVAGTFSHLMDLNEPRRWSADVDLVSTLDRDSGARILGPAGARALAPFATERPPLVRVRGRLQGPGNPGGPHTDLHIEAETDGIFRYEGFPLERVAFTADVKDDRIDIGPVSAGFAGGTLSGKGRVWGQDGVRRLSFEASLANATLGPAILVLEGFSAQRQHRSPQALGDFLKEKSDVQLDAAASAEGLFDDPYSFHGEGTAALKGAELGQVRMFGMLSELLRFTSLRFTSAKASFAIDGRNLVFQEISVTGANSGIAAHGTYALDRHALDFNARINPFQESKAFAQKFIDVFLAPLTGVLEVKLTGDIDKPRWMFANGPSNLLRNLGEESDRGAAGPALPAPLK